MTAENRKSRILTVGIGAFGRRAVRQVKRTIKNARCVFVDHPDEIAERDPRELKDLFRWAEEIFLVADLRDMDAVHTAHQLIENEISEGTATTVLTANLSETGSGELSTTAPGTPDLPCACMTFFPLSYTPCDEDFVAKFGAEMIAIGLICRFVRTIFDSTSGRNRG
jgi:hypothetical protein